MGGRQVTPLFTYYIHCREIFAHHWRILQFQQQAEIVTTLRFTLPPSPLPHSTKTETKWNSELLNQYRDILGTPHMFLLPCKLSLHNSNTVQFREKIITKPNGEQPKIKVEKMDRNFCVLNASTLHLSSLPLPILLMSDILC